MPDTDLPFEVLYELRDRGLAQPELTRLRTRTETAVQAEIDRELAGERQRVLRRSGGRFGQLGGLIALGLATAVAALVAVAAFALLHGQSNPSGQSQASSAQPLLRILGVLRRPQGHLGESVSEILGPGGRLRAPLGTPDIRLIRLATTTPWGQKVFLVPFKPATARSIQNLPPIMRRLTERQLGREGHAYRLGIFGGGGACCASASAIESHGTGTWGGDSNSTQLILVVPDGVAKVTLLLPAGQAGFTDSSRARTVTGPVNNNVLAVSFQGATDDPVQNMIWYGPHGNVVKRIGNTNGRRRSVPALPAGACPAPAARYLPHTAECLVIREGDVDGDGKPDLVLLYTPTHEPNNNARAPAHLTLGVVRASGGLLRVPIAPQGHNRPTIVLVQNVNARPGAEIFVDRGDSATGSRNAVYTFNGHGLVQAGEFLSGGYWLHPHGVFCHTGNPPTIVQRSLVLEGHAPNGNGRWRQTDTTYTWTGSTLHQTGRQTTNFTSPHYPANRTGFNC